MTRKELLLEELQANTTAIGLEKTTKENRKLLVERNKEIMEELEEMANAKTDAKFYSLEDVYKMVSKKVQDMMNEGAILSTKRNNTSYGQAEVRYFLDTPRYTYSVSLIRNIGWRGEGNSNYEIRVNQYEPDPFNDGIDDGVIWNSQKFYVLGGNDIYSGDKTLKFTDSELFAEQANEVHSKRRNDNWESEKKMMEKQLQLTNDMLELVERICKKTNGFKSYGKHVVAVSRYDNGRTRYMVKFSKPNMNYTKTLTVTINGIQEW